MKKAIKCFVLFLAAVVFSQLGLAQNTRYCISSDVIETLDRLDSVFCQVFPENCNVEGIVAVFIDETTHSLYVSATMQHDTLIIKVLRSKCSQKFLHVLADTAYCVYGEYGYEAVGVFTFTSANVWEPYRYCNLLDDKNQFDYSTNGGYVKLRISANGIHCNTLYINSFWMRICPLFGLMQAIAELYEYRKP